MRGPCQPALAGPARWQVDVGRFGWYSRQVAFVVQTRDATVVGGDTTAHGRGGVNA